MGWPLSFQANSTFSSSSRNGNLTLYQRQVHACLPVQLARGCDTAFLLSVGGQVISGGWHFLWTNEPEIPLPPKWGGHFPLHPSACGQAGHIPALWIARTNSAQRISTLRRTGKEEKDLLYFLRVSWGELTRQEAGAGDKGREQCSGARASTLGSASAQPTQLRATSAATIYV